MENKNFKLVVASGKGGVGKSMLTSVLVALFSRTKKVVAVDCDVDAPNLAIWLGGVESWDKTISVVASARPEINYKKCNGCGLCVKNCRFSALQLQPDEFQSSSVPRLIGEGILCEGCGVCEVVCPRGAIKLKSVQNGEIKIKYGLAGQRSKDWLRSFPLVVGQLHPGQLGSGKVVTEIKKEAEKFEHDLMIIDSPPGTGCPVIASLQMANLAILISEPTPSGFSDLNRVLEVVNHFKIPWRLVVNKWEINHQLSKKIEKWAGPKLLGKISYDQKIFKAVVNLKPILTTNLKVKKEIKKIFKTLKQWVDQ